MGQTHLGKQADLSLAGMQQEIRYLKTQPDTRFTDHRRQVDLSLAGMQQEIRDAKTHLGKQADPSLATMQQEIRDLKTQPDTRFTDHRRQVDLALAGMQQEIRYLKTQPNTQVSPRIQGEVADLRRQAERTMANMTKEVKDLIAQSNRELDTVKRELRAGSQDSGFDRAQRLEAEAARLQRQGFSADFRTGNSCVRRIQ